MIITAIFRIAQLLVAAVITGLSASLISGYGPGSPPSLIDYGAFCGGAGLVFATIGVVAIFFEPLQGIIILVLDLVAAFFLLAGGGAFAAEVKTGSCTDDNYLYTILRVIDVSPQKYESDAQADATARCRMAQADTAFIWILFVLFLVTIGLTFMSRSGKRGGALV